MYLQRTQARAVLAVGTAVALVLALTGQAAPNGGATQQPMAQEQQAAAPAQLPLLPVEPPPVKINLAAYHPGHGPNISGYVVLTYDDCPKSAAAYSKVVGYARQHNIGLVIAPTGECYRHYLKQGVNLAQLARDNGQYVINHSETHPNLKKLGYVRAKKQISGDVKADYGRPPYGARNATVDKAYAAAGIRQWLWDIDTNDWRGKSRKQVVDFTVAHACKGCTVLMHLQHKGFDVAAIAAINTGLRARGLYLCRAYRGWDNAGPVVAAPAKLGDNALPC